MSQQTSLTTSQRKDDHLRLALEQQETFTTSPFDEVRFVHHSFSHAQIELIDLSAYWADHHHPMPFYINAMTGGSQQSETINAQLAQLAHETQLAMASGSLSALVKHPETSGSFKTIRKHNPDGFILANLGAHHSVDNAQYVVDQLQADALQIHLNIPQEIVMPEGDRHFSQWLTNIETIVNALDVPVIVKEVGFGMSQQTIKQLIDIGVKTVDVGGRGGTNFITIENNRRSQFSLHDLADWGQTTPESLLNARPFLHQIDVLASGGIRHYLDIAKAIAMGAQACGIAGYFLHYLTTHGLEDTIQCVRDWQEALRLIYLMLGVESTRELQQCDWFLTGDLKVYQDQLLAHPAMIHKNRNEVSDEK